MKERGFLDPLYVTSAKKNLGCEELKQAILACLMLESLAASGGNQWSDDGVITL